jgi:cytochrome c553
MERIQRSILTASMLALALLGCGGDGGTGVDDGGDDPVDRDPPREIKANPSFQNDVREIFARRGCTASNCHGSSQQGGLGLATDPHPNLVGTPSVGCAGEIRVIANDAENSYLVKKLEGRQPQGCGSRMPLAADPLDEIDMANIRNWIARGALNN